MPRAPGYSLRRACRELGVAKAEGCNEVLLDAMRQLDGYFHGERRDFDVVLRPVGNPFQLRVWEELMRLSYGTTASYGDVARALGRPEAVRAVAGAIGANPLSIFIPCHRVVAANGPGGYAGGLPAKLHLLQLESDQGIRTTLSR
ncbi:MAG: methylated-DNA--[protein]-cysteine S-methyltransferase [Muribaculaceae bacterium]|nr:methylated-DNA--[protein]-cysteine S-methyltransferase [Muribaculaceae bacterium]